MNEEANTYYKLGLSKSEEGDYEGALISFNQAVEIDPENLSLYLERSDAKYFLDDFQGALNDITKAIELDPKNANIYHSLGLVKQGMSDLKGALIAFNQAIEIHPENHEYYSNRASIRSKLNDKKGAVDDYEKVLELCPGNIDAHLFLGFLKKDLGDMESACSNWKQGADLGERDCDEFFEDYCIQNGKLLFPDQANQECAELYLQTGKTEYTYGDLSNAIKDFGKAIRVNPQYSEAYLQRGIAQLADEYSSETSACQDWKKAAELGNKDAVKLLKEHCDYKPDTKTAAEHLDPVYQDKNSKDPKLTARETIKETYSLDILEQIMERGCASEAAKEHVYYPQTVKFYDDYSDEICDYIRDGLGAEELVRIFENNEGIIEGYKNDIVWTYIELLALEIVDEEKEHC